MHLTICCNSSHLLGPLHQTETVKLSQFPARCLSRHCSTVLPDLLRPPCNHVAHDYYVMFIFDPIYTILVGSDVPSYPPPPPQSTTRRPFCRSLSVGCESSLPPLPLPFHKLVNICNMSDSQRKSWSNNPDAPNISYDVYLNEKSDFAGLFVGSMLYGIHKTSPPTHLAIRAH